MRYQTLYTSERFGKGETSECVDEPLDAINSAVYLEAHHGSEVVLLGRRNGVPGMRGESRIVHALHRLVVAQEIDHARGVLAVDAHPSMKGPHTAKSEKAVERSACDSEAVRPPGQFFDQSCVCRYDRTA